MSPADNTPDFDSMSPEELMAWMETLAERQGAVEGFTTENRMEIEEIDPDSVQVEDNYIPYGMTPEEWEQRKAQEEAQRAERRAARAQQPSAATPQPAPPVAQPAAADETPDFDSMSPEEMMRWMESLAKRQGVDNETLTTTADMTVAEVDASTVNIEDNYWDDERRRREEKRQQLRQQPVASPPPPEPEPELPQLDAEADFGDSTEVAPAVDGMDWLENLAAGQVDDIPEMDLSALGAELDNLGDLDLGSLDLGSELADFDLGSLDALAGDVAQPQPTEAELSDPMAWLEGLTGTPEDTPFDLPSLDAAPEEETQASKPITSPPSPVQPARPAEMPAAAMDNDEDDVDPLEWLESLARRQGADTEELITGGSLDIPEPDVTSAADAPGYTDYAFEEPDPTEAVELPETVDALDTLDSLDASDPDDPVAWLESLAESHNADARSFTGIADDDDDILADDDDEDDENIVSKLNTGEDVSRDDVASWMSNLLEQGVNRRDAPPDYVEDDEVDAALEASIPDWLIEQVGQPPTEVVSQVDDEPTGMADGLNLDAVLAGDTTPEPEEIPDWLQDQAAEAEVVSADIPDWLQEAVDEAQPGDAESIFADEPAADLSIDADDPWVEAFELERAQGLTDISNVPDWYAEKIEEVTYGTVDEIDEAEEAAPQEPALKPAGSMLAQAQLEPETSLPPGEPEPLPDWLGMQMPLSATEMADAMTDTDEEDIPDWLQTEEEATVVDIPDWLQEHAAGYAAQAEAAADDMPDWLADADAGDAQVSEDIPQWLMETMEEEMEPAEPLPEPASVPAPQPVPASPAPVLASNIDVRELLQSAREKLAQGDIESCLPDYEAVVHANTQLDVVVADLGALLKDERHKRNAAIYRVLGDGLMRQGRLQDALDTYRRALNLL